MTMFSSWPRRFLASGLSVLFLSSCVTGLAGQEKPSAVVDLIIHNVTAIDAVNGVRGNVDIVVQDSIIVGVEDAGPKAELRAGRVIDGTGKYLIPGLWDAHVHLAYDPDIDHTVFYPLALAHGVTYLRDTGGRLEKLAKARAIASSEALAPDLYVSGPLIDGAKRVYAGQSDGFPELSIGVATVDQAMREVDQLAEAGVDFLKAYEMLSPEVFHAVVRRARFHGLPVTAHSPLSMTAVQAIEAGISDMQHLRNLEMDCVRDPEKLLEERAAVIAADESKYGGKLRSSLHRLQRGAAIANKDDASCANLIALMKKNGVSQTPTLTISRFLSRKLYAEKRWQDTFALMPKSVAGNWTEAATRLSRREPTARDIAYDTWLMTMVMELDEAGVSILAGTDAPIGYLTPGASLHEELAMLVEAGLTPMEAIRAATVAPAVFLGLEDEQGTIALRMKADMVLLNANPLNDIRNSLAISGVVKDGRFLDRTMLDRLETLPSRSN